MDSGDYQPKFVLNTGDPENPTVESNTDSFQIVDVGPTTSEVEGRVLLQARGPDKHSDTVLTLFRDGVQQGPSILTLADGRYMFDLGQGNYELRATHSGWLPETISFVVGTSGNLVDLGDTQLDAGDADGDEDVDSDDMRLFQIGLNQPPRSGIFTDPDDDNMTTLRDMAYGAMNFSKPVTNDDNSSDDE